MSEKTEVTIDDIVELGLNPSEWVDAPPDFGLRSILVSKTYSEMEKAVLARNPSAAWFAIDNTGRLCEVTVNEEGKPLRVRYKENHDTIDT